MIPAQPHETPHLAPLVAVGLPRLRFGADHWARRELADLIAALCGELHGRDCGTCTTPALPPSPLTASTPGATAGHTP